MLYPHWDSSMYYLVFVYVSFIIINVQKNQAASNVLLRVKELKYFHFCFSFHLFLIASKKCLMRGDPYYLFYIRHKHHFCFLDFLTLGLVPHYIFKLVLTNLFRLFIFSSVIWQFIFMCIRVWFFSDINRDQALGFSKLGFLSLLE